MGDDRNVWVIPFGPLDSPYPVEVQVRAMSKRAFRAWRVRCVVVRDPGENEPVAWGRKAAMNDKQKHFADVYLATRDVKASYLRAYGDVTEKTAYTNGHRLLKNAEISAYIDDAICARSERLQLDTDWVVRRWVRVYREAVQAEDRTAALKALDSLAKHLGLFEKHNKQKTPADQTPEAIRERLRQRGVDVDRMFPHARKPLTFEQIAAMSHIERLGHVAFLSRIDGRGTHLTPDERRAVEAFLPPEPVSVTPGCHSPEPAAPDAPAVIPQEPADPKSTPPTL